ncbi:MAG: ABC transporter permease [Burkholderiaceae bacterium]|nr:ABC transporter permease [Burkholderiaceae bacterium]
MTDHITPVETTRMTRLPALRRYVNLIGPMLMVIVLCIVMAVAEPRFFQLPNMMIVLHDAAIFMVLGMAMTLVITARGIDLSIGAVAALSAIVMAMLIKDYELNVYLAMIAAVGVGLLCGFVNSLIITRLHVPDLLATLAMDQIYRGIALVLAAGAVLARFPEPIPFIGRGRVLGGIPVSAIIGLAALAVGVVLYRSTHIGRYAAAIGGNREAALLSGINVVRHKTIQYVIMGGAAAVAGILLTGRLNAVQATVGQGLALHTIAAVVVGGTVLFGGRGTMLGTLVGVLLLSMVTNALVILRFQFFWQLVASGIVIIASIGFYSYMNRSGDDDGKEET